jgi:hypothetical protein
MGTDKLRRLEAEAAKDLSKKKALLKALHGRARDLKAEVRERLSHYTSEMSMKPVRRDYAFDDPRVPRGQQWVLKVTCGAAPGAVPACAAGAQFAAILGTSQSPLEALLLKRTVMGPSWLRIADATEVAPEAQTSWCKARPAAALPPCCQRLSTNLLSHLLELVGVSLRKLHRVCVCTAIVAR